MVFFNRLNKFIKVLKDPLSFLIPFVYRINCAHCKASYVGEKRRLLKSRIEEHRNHIRRNTSQISVITEHRLKHDFDWENVKILDKEVYSNKRLISEIIFIKKQSKVLNLQRDTELLYPIILGVLSLHLRTNNR